MGSWRRVIGFGFVMWLIPFIVAFAAFPLRESARPVFESIMAVTVTATVVSLGLRYLVKTPGVGVPRVLLVGVIWLGMSVLIDAPLMLLGGPMQMSLGYYLGDIALTYLIIPLVMLGLGAASVVGGRRGTAE